MKHCGGRSCQPFSGSGMWEATLNMRMVPLYHEKCKMSQCRPRGEWTPSVSEQSWLFPIPLEGQSWQEGRWWESLQGAFYSFARTAITKYHRLGGMNNRNVFSHSSGGQKSERKVSAGLRSSEASLLVCGCLPSPCVLTWFFLCAGLWSNLFL